MNIKDADFIVKNLTTDWLKSIFTRQTELMEKYISIEREKGVDAHHPVDMHTCRGQQRLKDIIWRCVEELGEASLCLKNRPWKQMEIQTDVDHFNEELADAFHFFVELCITAGLSAEDLTRLYFQKSQVNQFRQRSHY